jgi:hypothetical protein
MTQEVASGQSAEELSRICTIDGAIIRQKAGRDAQVLYPDGEVATFNKADSSWTIVNNKGKRQHYKDGVMRDIDSIPCAFETDPETKCVTMIREDDVVAVHYPDGSRFVQHADGTQIFTKDNEIRIEKAGFASHCVK